MLFFDGPRYEVAFELFESIFEAVGTRCGELVRAAWVECVLGHARDTLQVSNVLSDIPSNALAEVSLQQSGFGELLQLYSRAVRAYPCAPLFHNLGGECSTRGMHTQVIVCMSLA